MKNHIKKTSVVILLLLVFLLGTVQAAMASYGDGLLRWGSSGTYVKNLQTDLSNLGYNTYGIDGIFGSNTYRAVVAFQNANGISPDGIVGPKTKKLLDQTQTITYTIKPGDTLSKIAARYKISVNSLMQANNLKSSVIWAGNKLIIPTGKVTQSTFGEAADWWTVVSQVFARGDVATVTDINTGISFQVQRKGGTNHADVQPLTAQDTAKMKQAYGGYWSWARRAILVKVDGRVFAASQNGMPHGQQSIYNNNFPGHCCIHFKNSRTHGTNRVDAQHQAAVSRAAGWQ